MKTFVRKDSRSDIANGASSYPIYYKNLVLAGNFLIGLIPAVILLFILWKMLPSGTSPSTLTEALGIMKDEGKMTLFYMLGFVLCLCIVIMISIILLFSRNNKPQCLLSSEGMTFRDGSMIYWEDITENRYHESQYRNADGITVRTRNKKWGIKMPSIGPNDYFALCTYYRDTAE